MGGYEHLPDDYEPTEEDLAALAAEADFERDNQPSGEPAPATGDKDKGAEPPADADKGEGEPPESAGEGEPKGEGEEPPENGEPELGGLSLADLKDLGIGEFKDLETAKQSLKNLRTAVSRRDEDAALGRELRKRGVEPSQLDALIHQDPAAARREPEPKKGGPPEYDPAWESMVTPKHDDEGNVVGYDGPQEIVDKLQTFHRYQINLWNRIYRGDEEAIGTLLGPVIEQRVQERLGQHEAKSATQAFLETHYDFLKDHDEEFYGLLDQGASPELAVDYLRMKHKAPEAPAGGDKEGGEPDAPKDPKQADIEELRRGARQPRAPLPPPAKTSGDDLDLEGMDDEEIVRLAVKRQGIDVDKLLQEHGL